MEVVKWTKYSLKGDTIFATVILLLYNLCLVG